MSDELGMDAFEETAPATPAPVEYPPAFGVFERYVPDPKNFALAENAAVGSVLVDERVLDSVVSIAPPIMFTDPGAKLILQVMLAMREKHQAIDTVTVIAALHERGYTSYGHMVANCIDSCVASSNAANYARVVAGVYYEKQVTALAKNFSETQDRKDLESLGHAMVAKERLGLPLLFDYTKNLHGVLDAILEVARQPVSDTGFKVLDEVLLGVRAGEVITWGAAPNVGKSVTLLNLADAAAVRHRRGLYVGTEMSAMETVQRHLSIQNGIEPWKLRKGKVTDEDIRSLNDTLGDVMSKMNLCIFDHPSPTVKDIDNAITAARAQDVYLDYLERFTLPEAENYRLRVSEFMRQIKNLARSRGVVIHLASQLSRATYGKDERRPTMADLSESSGIEKESDRVILLWAPKEKQDPTPGSRKRNIEAILEKNRHGKKGLIFDLVLEEENLRITADEGLAYQPPIGATQVYLPGQSSGENN